MTDLSAVPNTRHLTSQKETSNMDIKVQSVVTIAGEAEIDHAIATLVLSFASDPVARWMYDDPHQYLLHLPRLFRALGTNSFATGAAQGTNDGLGVALWVPPGVHGDDGLLEAVIAGSIVAGKKADVAALFERAPLVPVTYRGRNFTSKQRVWRGITAARP